MTTSTKARKAKGRKLQNWTRDKVLETYSSLLPEDVMSTGMGQGGEDIKLSPRARFFFPYSVECKKHKHFAVYSPYEQAQANAKGHEPLLIIEGDRKKPLAILSAEHFFELMKKLEEKLE